MLIDFIMKRINFYSLTEKLKIVFDFYISELLFTYI
jgi:hypothetical protein